MRKRKSSPFLESRGDATQANVKARVDEKREGKGKVDGEEEEAKERAKAKEIEWLRSDAMRREWEQKTLLQCGRPPLRSTSYSTRESFLVQIFDADYFVDTRVKTKPVPVIRIWGVTPQGHSALVHVRGVLPYLFVPAKGLINSFGESLNAALCESQKRTFKRQPSHVAPLQKVDIIPKRASIYGFTPAAKVETQTFWKVTVAIPPLIPTTRSILNKGIFVSQAPGKRPEETRYESFESNIAFVLRYMIDAGIRGGGWVECKPGGWGLAQNSGTARGVSFCQIEVEAHEKFVVGHSASAEPQSPPPFSSSSSSSSSLSSHSSSSISPGVAPGAVPAPTPVAHDWGSMAPVRILSFDIECEGEKNHFPVPENDPVIQIASIVEVHGAKIETVVQVVHVLNTCTVITGEDIHIVPYRQERDLLLGWSKFVQIVDPDIFTGYNILGFDFDYLLRRADALGIADEFSFLGRARNMQTTVKKGKFESKGQGKRETNEYLMAGRVIFDILQIIKLNHKLGSYTLNAVTSHFLGTQKEDVHHSQIAVLQNGTEEDRARLARYCWKDAKLPLMLIHNQMLLVNEIEMARVTGVPISYLSTRGQQIKVVSLLYRASGPAGYLIPYLERSKTDNEKYEGAVVLQPKKGLYFSPIATLDFASLYPSIMMAHNLCYCTYLGKNPNPRLLPRTMYNQSPIGECFVKPSVKQGILPRILKELLDSREYVKKLMKAESDPIKKSIYNGRQLALKISANSVYGFTGALIGQLPCLAISSSVTAYGREMLEYTSRAVKSQFTVQNGYSRNADVVYGDTDSVMIKFGEDTKLEEAMRLGKEAAGIVTKIFPPPIKLEFEKVYWPYLLMNKKRYAGLYWTKPEKWDKMDLKGLETVRRDYCGLVREAVSYCLKKILVERNVPGAVNYIKQTVSDILQQKVDISKLVVSKSLGKSAHAKDYASKQVHVELAERMRKRDPLTAPRVGERVPYVQIQGRAKDPAYMKAEDPVFVMNHNIPIDSKYYQDSLQKAIDRIFEGTLNEDQLRKLWEGSHTRSIKRTSHVSGDVFRIMRFTVVKQCCLSCKSELKSELGEKGLCGRCSGQRASLICSTSEELREKEIQHHKLWTGCQTCQKSRMKEVICNNRDCPIFYKRHRAVKELDEVNSKMALLQDLF